MASGGPRQPANPAPVSNPGSGRRTDGGAGSKSQPLRVATGGAYGESKALTEQQQAAPLAADQGGSPVPQGGGASGPPPGPGGPGLFGPTARPSESIMAGVPADGAEQMIDADSMLRLLYSKRPSPYLARLLRD